MNVVKTPLRDLILIEPRIFTDERGRFLESYQSERYADLGLPPFVQDNVSVSRKGVLRGMHFQNPCPQAKLVTVFRGRAFDVAVDLRLGSPTFAQWYGVELSAEKHQQLYVPPGFAHGFAALTDDVVFHYKCTDFYHPPGEVSLMWNDPEIGIEWPLKDPLVSPKDLQGLPLGEIPEDRFVRYSH